jgi:hypothetical protein
MDIKTEAKLVNLAIQDWFGTTSVWAIIYTYVNKGDGDVEIRPWVESIDSFIVHIY